jgi:hypothetical protein
LDSESIRLRCDLYSSLLLRHGRGPLSATYPSAWDIGAWRTESTKSGRYWDRL